MRTIADPTRTIHIPLSGYVDVTGMEAIINHPYFARLRFRRQLGFTCMVKPGGLHSRLEHSVGTLHTVRLILDRFRIPRGSDQYRAMEVYAVLHDVGHGPTSHELEYLLGKKHEEIGQARVAEMREAIATFVDPELVLKLMRGDDPWSILVKHKVFGADKLDYLERDAYHIGYDIAMNKGKIIACLQFANGVFGIDEEAKEEIITNLANYQRMYLEVYLHRTVKMFARIYQRILMESLESGAIDATSVWDMIDLELHARLMDHPLMQRITERRMLATVMCFKIQGFDIEEHYEVKGNYSTIAVREDVLEGWSEHIHGAANVVALERALEVAAKTGDRSVFLVQTDPLGSLLDPPPISIYSRYAETFCSLYETTAITDYEYLRRTRRAYYLCVMCVPEALEKLRAVNLRTFFESYFKNIVRPKDSVPKI